MAGDSSTPVVVDLDRMVSKSIGIRFNGTIHKIKPMTLDVLLRTINEIAVLDGLRKKENIPVEEIREGYARVFGRCSSTLAKASREMNDVQIALVLRQIVECITGKAYSEDAQKKNSLTQNLQPQ